MKIRNKVTLNVFDLPKAEVEMLINENPNIYEKANKKIKKKKKEESNTNELSHKSVAMYEQNTILPLIWEE